MEFRIPKTFHLLGTKWKIVSDKEIYKENKGLCSGQVNYEKRTIRLLKGFKQIQLVLFHELSHVLNHLTSIGLEKTNSETFADINSLFWCQVFNQIKKNEIKKSKKKSKTLKKIK